MEYFDVVDANRNPLNYKKVRGTKQEENEYSQGVEMWIINNNSILMTKRSPEKSHPGNWEVPGGGCQAGETPMETMKREISEEIGVTLTEKDITLIDTTIYHQQFVDMFTTKHKIDLKNTKLQVEEVSDIKFVTKDEFYKMKENNQIVPSVANRFELIKDKLKIDW